MALFPLIFFLILFAAVGIPLILYYTGVIGDKNNDDPIPLKSTTTYSGKTNDVLPLASDTTTTTNQLQIKPVQ
uniref:Uncharacterized protein n=1 Tax=viral metagenome TaxID=1070528 RepID=A0A6C0EA17_9ZZZZ